MRPYLTSSSPDEAATIDEFVGVHGGFHGAVASLAGNRVLELTFQTMGQIVTHHIAVTSDPRGYRTIIEDDHHEIARAITSGHAQRARTLMHEHLEGLAYELMRSSDQLDGYIEWR